LVYWKSHQCHGLKFGGKVNCKTELNSQLEEYAEASEVVLDTVEQIDEIKKKHLYKPELTYKLKKRTP
uniref:hypothetical protein n=1 Tax=Shewanella algae TaxID=38313 RepID=UPI00300435EB